MGMTLGNNGGTEAGSEVVGKFVKLGVAIDFDGFFGGIANHKAVVAPRQMVFKLSLGTVVYDAVEIIGQLLQKLRAFHLLPSPLSRLWK
jgi:hypothetical protein